MGDVRDAPPGATAPTADREQILADLLNQLSDRVAGGEAVDIHKFSQLHPEYADELRELWGAVMLANAVGSQVQGASPTIDEAPDITSTFELPCRLGTDFELLQELGRGGMGVVYKARQISLNRIVALKMLLRGRFASATDQARFRAEAEAIAQLDHPHIVPIYEVGQLEGHVFFSMKYVEGETLLEQLADGPLAPREAARIMARVARAIDFAHRRGVLHRDLKPSNVLIDREGQPHVNDFGLAKQSTDTKSLTRSGAVLGTPAYMSPEQAGGGGPVGPPSDVYGLGCILYHAITGQPPFLGRSAVDVVLKVLEQDVPLARSINPQANRDLEMVALRCLQKPTDLRYPSAAALARDLEAWLADEPVSARSGRFSQVVAMLFRETHHAALLQNWGLLWMWHSVVLLVVCLLTQALQWRGVAFPLAYFMLWTAGLGMWASVFWRLRRRMGPVTFVERQIAHVWASSMISIALLFPLEHMMGFPVLTLSPLLGLSSGTVFLVKAAMLSGSFYIQALTLFLTSFAMARWPEYGHLIFGVVAAACFFIPGWKYHQQKLATEGRSNFEAHRWQPK